MGEHLACCLLYIKRHHPRPQILNPKKGKMYGPWGAGWACGPVAAITELLKELGI